MRAEWGDRLSSIHTGISLFASPMQLRAALPLFESGEIEAVEWTLDQSWELAPLPTSVTSVLDSYAAEGRLYGHGLRLSPSSARFDASSERWLRHASDVLRAHRVRHVTEHWGFSRTRGMAQGAPFPLVASEAAIACTTHALRALREVSGGAPVGLENLALALSADELETQPAMLARILDAVDGVLLFDLHNLWCQAVNYGRDVRELALHYPLGRVRQLHVAGGRWSDSAFGAPMRRDTHDDLVPAEVLELVSWMIPRCPNLEVVILERLPETLEDPASHEPWRAEFRALAEVVEASDPELAVVPPATPHPPFFREATLVDLADFQDALALTLYRTLPGTSMRDVHATLLGHPSIAPFRDEVARYDLRALEIAVELAHTWGAPM